MTLFAIAARLPAARLPAAAPGLLARLRAALAPRRAADCLPMADAHVLSDIGFVRTPEAPRAQLAG